MDIKETFCRRIHGELQSFKEELLKESREVIYDSSYKIEVFVNLYGILAEFSGEMTGEAMENMLQEDPGILETLYQEWLKHEDGFYGELKEYAGNVPADKETWKRIKTGKGDLGNGKKCDTAA